MLWIAALILSLAACKEDGDAPADTFLADLQRRCERLKPHVERETGRPLGEVEILVVSREQIENIALPELRESLARVENGPRGDVLEADARAMAKGHAFYAEGTVDRQGRILFPDPAEERDGLLGFIIGLFPMPEVAKDPRRFDLILVHELVHVHQHRHLESAAFRESVRSRADILARRAVLEGHAEHLARRIAAKIGLADVHEEFYRARTEPSPRWKGFARVEGRISVADLLFPYRQGRDFVDFVVEKLGYEEAVRRIFEDPPSLNAVSRPEEYFRLGEPSRWGPILEDLRRWLVRERGEADLEVLALPMVRELAGDPAEAFREGFRLRVGLVDIVVHVLVTDDAAGARRLHRAWTEAVERIQTLKAETGFSDEVCRRREPDDWMLHYTWPPEDHTRRTVIREGPLIVDVECRPDSEVEQGAGRLARRAMRILTDRAWRAAWLEGGRELLTSKDAGLRLAAVTRMKRVVLDEDWEVRWLGRWHAARDESKLGEERVAILTGAIEDTHPAVVARGLRAALDLNLWEVPWPLLRRRLWHRDVAVRREAWALARFQSVGEEDESENIRRITRALDDRDLTVRKRAVECLIGLEPQLALLPVFRKALRDDHSRVRQEAVLMLAIHYFEFPELIPDLIGLLEENPDNVATALGKLGDAAKEALPHLRKALENPDGRAEAAQAVWRIAADPEPLLALVRESVADGRTQGIAALGELGSAARPVVPEVTQVLAHDNRWVRIAAAKALGKIGGVQARNVLSERLKVEKHKKVLKSIREALDQLKD